MAATLAALTIQIRAKDDFTQPMRIAQERWDRLYRFWLIDGVATKRRAVTLWSSNRSAPLDTRSRNRPTTRNATGF